MDRQDNAAPVIIRKKKVTKGDGGHHGGAWKVAYADFVTAMMAFFLIMWLMNATTESQRKGLADYFSPSIPVNRISGGGDGAFGGDSVFSEENLTSSGVDPGSGPTQSAGVATAPLDSAPDRADARTADAAALEELEELLFNRGGESSATDLALRHIVTRISDEGLIVEIFDLPGAPLFDGESDRPMPVMDTLAGLVAEVFGMVGNGVAIEGHTRAYPVVLARNPIWNLSTARAQRTRSMLVEANLDSSRMRRITGHGDRRPAIANKGEPRNNRLELILLRSEI